MAILKNAKTRVDVPDGGPVREAARELGVTFGCSKGVCGACVAEVMEGMDNLAAMTDAEKAFGMRPGDRMMCQCTINGGEVQIR
ncbi:ferredoxin [bacterium DOLJORAL78_65_58]|nr:MAG: ferredoxin [bacterium DOLZORAL124_64_63]PIE75460.1 MAG: ferredoxin [bacterium DOLJORAL78_65_58]